MRGSEYSVRSHVVGIVALAIVLTPPALDAQQPAKMARIGYLSLHPRSELDEAFLQGLREQGWFEGQNIHVEWRFADWKAERLRDLAAELLRLKVDLIFTTSTLAVQAARNATRTVPIVFTNVGDPVRPGLVANLARPGGNITGFTTINVELSAKRLELLKESIPGIARVAVLVNPESPQAPFLLEETKAAASALGLRLKVLDARRPDDIEKAFAAINGREIGAVLVLPDPLHNVRATQARIASLAAKGGLPVMAPYRGNAEAGALMSYGTNLPDLFRRGAVYVDKVLKGAKPAELPVEQPTTFELVINLKTARAMGLTIPQSVLIRADHVIQ